VCALQNPPFLTFWDLLESLISGSHDCGFD
jgi:hypothetical protein